MRKPARKVKAPNDMPIAIRSRLGRGMSEDLETHIRDELATVFEPRSALIERSSVELARAAKGSDDIACRIQVVMSGRPGVAVEEAGEDAETAFTAAAHVLERELDVLRDPRDPVTGRRIVDHEPPNESEPGTDHGSLIGRRVGHGRRAHARALERESTAGHRAGGNHTARRNALKRAPRAIHALEDSATGQPSRKSTRRGGNRVKSGEVKHRTQLHDTFAPVVRHNRRSTH